MENHSNNFFEKYLSIYKRFISGKYHGHVLKKIYIIYKDKSQLWRFEQNYDIQKYSGMNVFNGIQYHITRKIA